MDGPFILGFPWWLSVAVVLVFAALLWYVFDGWVRPLVRLPLVLVLAPACLLVTAVVATALSVALSGPYEPLARPERTAPTTTTPIPSTAPTTMQVPSTGPATTGTPLHLPRPRCLLRPQRVHRGRWKILLDPKGAGMPTERLGGVG